MRRSGYLSPLFRFSLIVILPRVNIEPLHQSACFQRLNRLLGKPNRIEGEVSFFSDMTFLCKLSCRNACKLTVAQSVFQALTPMICPIFLQAQHSWLGIRDVYPLWNPRCQNQGTQRWPRFFHPCCLAQRQLLFCHHLFCNSDSNYRHFF